MAARSRVPARMLICTVGTSLLDGNVARLEPQLDSGTLDPASQRLVHAYRAHAWDELSAGLGAFAPSDRACGAEINSIASMVERGYVSADCGLCFMHSDTGTGRATAAVLAAYYRARGHAPVRAVSVAGLQDDDPKRFRTAGLRNLTREICRVVRERSAAACAINATGGYKAQIAIGVLLGQALGVPVYYKHERFSEVIAFPPLPVSLDFDVWMRASGMLFDLERTDELVPARAYTGEWDERWESLVERVEVDGTEYLGLSPAGQIFHETFRERYRTDSDEVLPPTATRKRAPRWEASGHMRSHPEVLRFMQRITEEVAQVQQCSTFHYNPDLPDRTRFHLGSRGIEGVYSDGSMSVKFRVDTTATTEGQLAAVFALLSGWLSERR